MEKCTTCNQDTEVEELQSNPFFFLSRETKTWEPMADHDQGLYCNTCIAKWKAGRAEEEEIRRYFPSPEFYWG